MHTLLHWCNVIGEMGKNYFSRFMPCMIFLNFFGNLGKKIEGEGLAVTRRTLAERCGESPSSCHRAWNRRNDLENVGVVKRRKGQGRKRVAAFATPQAKRQALAVLENLPIGQHLPHAAE